MCFLVQTVNTRAQAGHKLLEVQPALRVMGLVRVTRMVHLVKVAQIPWQDTELVVVAVIMGVAQAALRVLGEEVVTRALLPPAFPIRKGQELETGLSRYHGLAPADASPPREHPSQSPSMRTQQQPMQVLTKRFVQQAPTLPGTRRS